MSETHTPGPWLIQRKGPVIIKSIGPCEPDEYAGAAWLEVSEADARLIAAAPELLEALKKALNFIANTESEMGERLPSGDAARAAIAKATGSVLDAGNAA